MNTKETVKKTVKVVTIAGAAVLAVNSVMQLTKVSSPKTAVMPIVSLLVAVAAFNYAMSAEGGKVSLKTSSAEGTGEDGTDGEINASDF